MPGAAQKPLADPSAAAVLASGTVLLAIRGERCSVPLSSATAYNTPNPKAVGSSAWSRYERYMKARTLGDALRLGAFVADVRHDFAKGLLKLPKFKPKKVLALHKATNDREASTVKASSSSCALLPLQDIFRTGLRSGISGDLGHGAPFAHVVSLGSRCVVARVLCDVGLRRYAAPFDWIYTSAEMVRHCLKDDFSAFLDRRNIVASGNKWGHRVYGPMLGRGVIYPHHEPRDKDRQFFGRTVSRFRCILASPARKLFVLVHPIESARELQAVRDPAVTGGGSGTEIRKLFADLRTQGVRNFQLIAIHMLARSASQKGSGRAMVPQVRPVHDTGPGKERLLLFELHCVGDCTGVRFKKDADEKAMRGLLAGTRYLKRRAELEADPLPPRSGPSSSNSRRRLGDPAQET